MVLFFIFPKQLKQVIMNITRDIANDGLEEIRLRADKPLVLKYNNKILITEYIVSADEINDTIGLAVEYSVYAHNDEIKNGYITIEGGHRIGVCGQVVCENGVVTTIKHISSINIRVAHQIKGCADKLIGHINGDNILIISPPGCGKTTLLRDIVRQLSDKGNDIGLVDERGEIAAAYLGIAQNDVGICTDVLSFCKKSIGMIMLIRSMAPKIVVADEIGGSEDIEALIHAGNSGCRVIATIHGSSIDEIDKDIVRHFDKFILIHRSEGNRYYSVVDKRSRVLV